jgi:hypothetical protein
VRKGEQHRLLAEVFKGEEEFGVDVALKVLEVLKMEEVPKKILEKVIKEIWEKVSKEAVPKTEALEREVPEKEALDGTLKTMVGERELEQVLLWKADDPLAMSSSFVSA